MALGRTPEELGATVSSKEYTEFQSLYRIDPWDFERVETAIARLTAITYNCNVKEAHNRLQPIDFLPYHRLRKATVRQETHEGSLWATLRATAKAQQANQR